MTLLMCNLGTYCSVNHLRSRWKIMSPFKSLHASKKRIRRLKGFIKWCGSKAGKGDIPIPIVAKRPEASLHQGTLLSPFYLNFLEIAVVHCLPSFLLAGIATSPLFFLLFHVDIFLSASSNISEVCFDIAQYLTSSSFCNRLFLCHDPLKYCGFTFSS